MASSDWHLAQVNVAFPTTAGSAPPDGYRNDGMRSRPKSSITPAGPGSSCIE